VISRVRVGLRLARRSLLRRPWRSALVLLLVILPTAAMAASAVVVRSSYRSPAAERTAAYGQADMTADAWAMGSGGEYRLTEEQLDDLRASLQGGSTMVTERRVTDRADAGDRWAQLDVSDIDVTDPMFVGRFERADGRGVASETEAVLPADVAAELDLDLGDHFTLARLDRRLQLVGTVQPRTNEPATAYVSGLDGLYLSTIWVNLDGNPVPRAVAHSVLYPVGSPDSADTRGALVRTYLLGAAALLALITVIAAAFAVGARQQVQTLGKLSASGASPAVLRWTVLAEGVTVGVLGSVVGIGLGAAVMRLIPRSVVDGYAGHPVDGLSIRLIDLVPIVMVGVGAAVAAAWLPARSASKVTTLQALAGRGPVAALPAWLPLAGAAAVTAGSVLLGRAANGDSTSNDGAEAVAGLVLLFAGVLAVAPAAVAGLGRWSGMLPTTWRMAARSLARNRLRSSAVLGAIVAVTALLVGAGTVYRTSEAAADEPRPGLVQEDQIYFEGFGGGPVPPDGFPSPDVLAQIGEIVPGATVIPLDELTMPSLANPDEVTLMHLADAGGDRRGDGNNVGVATPDLLDLFEVPAPLREALAEGQSIRVRPTSGEVDHLVVFTYNINTREEGEQRSVPFAGSFHNGTWANALPDVLISEETAHDLGLQSAPDNRTLFVFPQTPSAEQRDQLALLAEDFMFDTGQGPVDGIVSMAVPEPPPPDWDWVRSVVAGAALLLVLAIVTIGLALAAKDNEDETRTLWAVGASPRTLRQLGARRPVLLVLAAAALVIPAGLLPAALIVRAEGYPLLPDWWSVLFVVVVLPLVVGLVASVGGRALAGLRPTRPDVLAFGD
jgi:putative ABC transport system permease protein